jgi:hypothetical protein
MPCQRVLGPVTGADPPQSAETAAARVPPGWSRCRRDPGRHVMGLWWARRCVVEPVTTLGRDAIALPRYEFSLTEGTADEFCITLTAEGPSYRGVEQPILAPCTGLPIQVRLTGDGREQVIKVARYQPLRLRPFDPSRDTLTEHEQTDARLLAMFGTLDPPEFRNELERLLRADP